MKYAKPLLARLALRLSVWLVAIIAIEENAKEGRLHGADELYAMSV